jgi:hypothetical protein
MWEKGKNNNEGDWRFIKFLISPSPLLAPFYFLHMFPYGFQWFIIIYHIWFYCTMDMKNAPLHVIFWKAIENKNCFE